MKCENCNTEKQHVIEYKTKLEMLVSCLECGELTLFKVKEVV